MLVLMLHRIVTYNLMTSMAIGNKILIFQHSKVSPTYSTLASSMVLLEELVQEKVVSLEQSSDKYLITQENSVLMEKLFMLSSSLLFFRIQSEIIFCLADNILIPTMRELSVYLASRMILLF